MRKRMRLNEEQNERKLKDGFEEFILNCKIRNLSESTILYYKESYSAFISTFDESNPINKINKKIIDKYIIYLKENTSCNVNSINTRLRGIRSIIYYFAKQYYLEKFEIKLLKADKQIKEVYTDDELKILLAKPNVKTSSFTEYRNWCITNVLIGTAIRAGSLVNLKIKDVDFFNGFIFISKTKNRKQQNIPLSKTLSRVLQEYLKYRNHTSIEDYLFCSAFGEQMTTNSLKKAIRKYNLKRGVQKTSCHLYRHTFVKKYLLGNPNSSTDTSGAYGGGDVFRLQKLLGHSSLQVLNTYTNIYSKDLKQDYDRLNPLEQLSSKKEYIKMKK